MPYKVTSCHWTLAYLGKHENQACPKLLVQNWKWLVVFGVGCIKLPTSKEQYIWSAPKCRGRLTPLDFSGRKCRWKCKCVKGNSGTFISSSTNKSSTVAIYTFTFSLKFSAVKVHNESISRYTIFHLLSSLYETVVKIT